MKFKILIACEYSGVVREAFAKLGHDAWSCDILPSDIPGKHIQDDVLNHLNEDWDLMIAHPPCTYLCNSGVCWLKKDKGRYTKMQEGALFFKKLLDAPIPMIAIENPIMHKYAVEIIGRRQEQVIQPFMFGHPERKATCLWLKNLPLLKPINNVQDEMNKLPKSQSQRIHYTSPGKDRWKIRSKTFEGIANAMAKQWSEYLEQQIAIPSDSASQVSKADEHNISLKESPKVDSQINKIIGKVTESKNKQRRITIPKDDKTLKKGDYVEIIKV